jgi:hypothetical protein
VVAPALSFHIEVMITTTRIVPQRRHASQKLWLLALGILLAGCNRLLLG